MDVGKGNFRSASFVIAHSSCVRCLLRVRCWLKKEERIYGDKFGYNALLVFGFRREIGSARNEYLHCESEIKGPVGEKVGLALLVAFKEVKGRIKMNILLNQITTDNFKIKLTMIKSEPSVLIFLIHQIDKSSVLVRNNFLRMPENILLGLNLNQKLHFYETFN